MFRKLKYAVLALLASTVLSVQSFAQDQFDSPDWPSMAGQTILITGSTDGLGREVALRLGALGGHILVHGRNLERGAEVVDAINASMGSAQFYHADLGSLAQVRQLAAAVLRDHSRLDMLINNAGIGSGTGRGQRTESSDGYELIFQVNYLSHYLLTDLLLPLIKDSAPARIINVASGAQRPINFDDVMMVSSYTGGAAYAQSKLAQVLHTFDLARELRDTGVTVNTLHPATMMDTTLVRQMGSPARTTVDEGAGALMNLAANPALAETTGLYFNGLNEARANAQAYDREARANLNILSRQLTGLED